MHLGPRIRALRPRIRWAWYSLLVLLAVAALGAGSARVPLGSESICTPGGSMTEARMLAMNAARYGKAAAKSAAVQAAAADTFFVTNYQFNADHNSATQVDEVHILAGQSVMFKYVTGVHTATSGYYYDVNPGAIFDIPVDSSHLETVITFPNTGTYPFFCQYHGEYFNMVGTIVVDAPTPTRSSSWGGVKAKYR